MAQTREKSRIFVVDDELIIASTLATILRMNGFDALSFTRPQEALQAAREKVPLKHADLRRHYAGNQRN